MHTLSTGFHPYKYRRVLILVTFHLFHGNLQTGFRFTFSLPMALLSSYAWQTLKEIRRCFLPDLLQAFNSI